MCACVCVFHHSVMEIEEFANAKLLANVPRNNWHFFLSHFFLHTNFSITFSPVNSCNQQSRDETFFPRRHTTTLFLPVAGTAFTHARTHAHPPRRMSLSWHRQTNKTGPADERNETDCSQQQQKDTNETAL